MTIAVADSRGRVTVGEKGATYQMTRHDDGSIVLRPAEVLTTVEIAALKDAALQARVAESMAHPERKVPYRRRSPRRTDA
jgi:hypothetical protein